MIGLFVVAIAAHICYDTGFDHGTAEAEARQADAVKIAQNEVKKGYEKRIQKLTASLERVRNEHSERLRQLEQFRGTRRDLETCNSQLSSALGLAVEGERLLNEANGYIESLR